MAAAPDESAAASLRLVSDAPGATHAENPRALCQPELPAAFTCSESSTQGSRRQSALARRTRSRKGTSPDSGTSMWPDDCGGKPPGVGRFAESSVGAAFSGSFGSMAVVDYHLHEYALF